MAPEKIIYADGKIAAIIVDGQSYKSYDEIPDFGSIVCVAADEETPNRRCYEGLLSDVDKLPHYVDSGSSALLYDGAGNTEVYHFLKEEDQWFKL